MYCPICENTTGAETFIKNSYRILQCTDCDHSYTDVKLNQAEIDTIYSDEYFYGGKNGYPDYTIEKDILIKRGEYFARKVKNFLPTGRVLDAGAAAGFILKGFENKGWKGVGIEPNCTMAAYGRNVMKLDVRKGNLETAEVDGSFDLVIIIQVIAHFFDLNKAMTTIGNHLRAGGMVLIETWNKASYTARFFGENWHEYSPPTTLNFFSKKSLDILMTKYGYQHIKTGRPLKMIHSLHAKDLLRQKMEETPFLKHFSAITRIIPDNMALPYPAEDLFWTIYQKNE